MLDTLTTDNFEDFRTRYRGTYGWLCHNDSEKLTYIRDVQPNRVVFDTMDDTEFWAHANARVMFKFLPITRGWFQTSTGPILLMRVAVRQYQRGISSNNTQTTAFLADGRIRHMPTLLNLKNLFDIFNPTKEQQPFTPGTRAAQVLSKHFALGPLIEGHRALYLYDSQIGALNQVSNTLKLANPTVTQEVSDLITRNNLPFKIV